MTRAASSAHIAPWEWPSRLTSSPACATTASSVLDLAGERISGRVAAAAATAPVHREHREALLERGQHGAPARVVGGRAVHQHERRAVAAAPDRDRRAVEGDDPLRPCGVRGDGSHGGAPFSLSSGVQAVEPEEVVLDGQDLDPAVAGLAGQLAHGVGRITVPMAAEGCSASEDGRQWVTLQPYIVRSTSSPGAWNSSATRSSTTSTAPSGARAARAAASAAAGSAMSCSDSRIRTRS